MTSSATPSPTAPFGIRLALIALLPVLALAIYLDGQRYDADLVELAPSQSTGNSGTDLLPDTLAGLDHVGQMRRFGSDNLYEYINGHAEYFIGAGFRSLVVGEYGDAGDGQPALIVNLYDLGAPLNAFGVLVDEAGDREAVEIGALGFRSDRGLSFILGPYFAQINQFGDTVPAEDAAADLSRTLGKGIEETDLAFRFPDLGRVIATRFVNEYYRGLEFVNGVLERSFERNGNEVEAFLVQGSGSEIAELTQAFETFFREDEMPFQRIERNGLAIYHVDDPYEDEWFFVPLTDHLVGIYAPPDDELLAAIAAFSAAVENPQLP